MAQPQICWDRLIQPVALVELLPTLAYNPAIIHCGLWRRLPAAVARDGDGQPGESVEGILWDQSEMSARFKTAGIHHNLVAGVEGGQETSNPIRYSYVIKKINTGAETTLLNPDEAEPFAGTGYNTSIVHTKAKTVGMYFIDTLHLGRLIELSGGIRWDRFDTDYNLYQPTPPPGGAVTPAVLSISRLDEQPSYRAALVYKPSTRGSIYFDYGTSFNPSAESIKPERRPGKQRHRDGRERDL